MLNNQVRVLKDSKKQAAVILLLDKNQTTGKENIVTGTLSLLL
jgi:hypothetical protein